MGSSLSQFGRLLGSNTLSGGESFLASLALALALAESVASFGADGSHAGRLEALFLDDKIENIEAAHRVGLNAIQFTNVHQLQQDLASNRLLSDLPMPGTVPERSTRA